jgi:hypothetical protein
MSEAELGRDLHAALLKVQQGVEIVIEQDQQAVAIIRSPNRSGRPISECIASAEASGAKVTLDAGFAKHVEDGIRDRQQP